MDDKNEVLELVDEMLAQAIYCVELAQTCKLLGDKEGFQEAYRAYKTLQAHADALMDMEELRLLSLLEDYDGG